VGFLVFIVFLPTVVMLKPHIRFLRLVAQTTSFRQRHTLFSVLLLFENPSFSTIRRNEIRLKFSQDFTQNWWDPRMHINGLFEAIVL
jgi:hypothetical protein